MRVVALRGRAARRAGGGPARGAGRLRRRHAAGRAVRAPRPGTSRSRCSPTPTATSSTSASASAACSGGTRRSSRRPRRRCSTAGRRRGRRWARPRSAAARSVGYVGAGTVEFIVAGDDPDEFFFMEMNTRLQVEHPVTELVYRPRPGRVAAAGRRGRARCGFGQADVRLTGHAVEARVYAEDPARGFLPTGGTVARAAPAGRTARPGGDGPGRLGPGRGTDVGSDYDPMLAKVIAHGARTAPPRCAAWTPPSPRRSCSASPPTSPSCGRCWPTPTSWPAAWTPGWPSGSPTRRPASARLPAPPEEVLAAARARPAAGARAGRPAAQPVGHPRRVAGRRARLDPVPRVGARARDWWPRYGCAGCRRRGPRSRWATGEPVPARAVSDGAALTVTYGGAVAALRLAPRTAPATRRRRRRGAAGWAATGTPGR